MASNQIHKYPLGGLLRRSLLEGFVLEEGQQLRSIPAFEGRRSVFFPAIDSATPDCPWGRISYEGSFLGECVLTMRAFSSNDSLFRQGGEISRFDDFLLDPSVPADRKERLFTLANGQQQSSGRDMLLLSQQGRFLWIWIELSGEGSAQLSDLRVYVPGDNFFHTLPAVYQTDGEFFHRYLSIFSTMYREFDEKLDALPQLFDAKTAPDFMLPMLASWLGIETDESLLSPEQLRQLLLLAPELIRRKGTRWAVETVVKLFTDQPLYLVERNLLAPEQRRNEDLYGNSPYDFTIMLEQAADEKLRLQLQFLVDQFKPLRANCRIVFLNDCGGLDAFTYLDINGTVLQSIPGSLDDGNALAGMTYLQ